MTWSHSAPAERIAEKLAERIAEKFQEGQEKGLRMNFLLTRERVTKVRKGVPEARVPEARGRGSLSEGDMSGGEDVIVHLARHARLVQHALHRNQLHRVPLHRRPTPIRDRLVTAEEEGILCVLGSNDLGEQKI